MLRTIMATCFGWSVNSHNQAGKVKIKVKVKVTLEQATKAQRASRGIALFFL
jgi:predicted secreted Zn-dependent protease